MITDRSQTVQSNGDPDSAETREWLDALEGVLQTGGPDRARFLLTELKHQAIRHGVEIALVPIVRSSRH